jgi:hypothetical protein
MNFKVLLTRLLGEKHRASLFQFLMLLEFHFSPVFNPETEGEFENKWHQALACIERDFPSSLQTFVFHLSRRVSRTLKFIWCTTEKTPYYKYKYKTSDIRFVQIS